MKKPSIWFWVIAAILVVWNLFGCALYILDVTTTDARYAELYGDAKAAARGYYPTWATAAFAVAVWSGLLASGFLLLRRSLSVPIFFVSLVAAILCFIPVFVSTPLRESGGETFWVMPTLVIAIGLFQVWFARRKRADGTLK
ncbi:MAG: hypothetical protein ACSHX3_11720 [Litorimonas sp.]